MFFSKTLAYCIVLQINMIFAPRVGRMLSWKVLLDETRLDLTKNFNQKCSTK